MMDIDHFKQVNDTHGHKAGDRALRLLGEIILLHIRDSDIACRYGGEEFVLVLPETSLQIAAQRAEHIRREFQSAKSFKDKVGLMPTLSVGVAAFPRHGKSAEIILDAADQAMYAAKAGGGNATFVRSGRGKSVSALKQKTG
jgi:diguanylate cyclase (GGDEF)-like protein